MLHKRTGWSILTVALAMLVAMAQPVGAAHATPGGGAENSRAVQVQAAIDKLPAVAIASGTATAPGIAVSSTSPQGSIDIADNAGNGVAVTTAFGTEIRVGLPAGGSTRDAVQLSPGTAIYTGAAPSTSLAVQPLEADGFRALIVIEDEKAPSSFRFPVKLPAGAHLETQEDGTVNIIDGNGKPAGHFDVPWAVDSTGAAVPTSLEVQGHTIVQVVEHSQNYPVVADPHYTWGWISGTVYFNKSETIKFAAGAWAVTAWANWAPPPFGQILASLAAYIALVASWAAADGRCVYVNTYGHVGIYSGSAGDGYCR
jgi:hypothetical protein